MEKFSIFSFDDIFYSKSEIEEMGLLHLNYEALKELLREKNKKGYFITTHSSMTESRYSLEEYLDTYHNTGDEMVFFKDAGNSGICIDFKEYYGIRFHEEIVLFSNIFTRDREYQKMESNLLKQFEQINKSDATMEYVRDGFFLQESIKQKQKKLLEIVHAE